MTDSRTLARIVVWFTAAVFIIYGLVFAVAPVRMMEFVSGGPFSTMSAVIDARSTFGGMTIAVGLLIAMLGRNEQTLPMALTAIAIVLSAMAVTRLLGIFVDGDANSVMYAYLGAEIVGTLLALTARRSLLRLIG